MLPAFAAAEVHGIDESLLEQLSNDPTWHKLMHYEPDFFGKKVESAIHSPEFFLSKDGKNSPKSELLETIRQLQAGVIDDNSAQCTFPARHLWLTDRLGTEVIPASDQACSSFSKWTKDKSYKSISMVFATGYLSNPASYYGHTFLKINYAEKDEGRLQDISINFGANTGPDPLSYIYKGITGGYQAQFNEVEYYTHQEVYAEEEDRDMWEYQLNLSDQQVDMIVAHAWEVLNKNYTYYFFGKNCAYQTSQVIDLIPGIESNTKSSPWTIPQSSIQAIGNTVLPNGEPLVARVIRDPSRTTRYHNKAKNLSTDEMNMLKDIGKGETGIESDHYQGMGTESKLKVIDALIDYSFIHQEEEPGLKDLHQQALQERYKLPPRAGDEAVSDRSQPPHMGKPPSMIEMGASHSGSTDSFTLRMRPAYYDPLDVSSGTDRVNAMSMGDITVSMNSQGLHLDNLDILKIESVNHGYSWLPGDRPGVWSFSAGIKPISLECDSCLTPKIEVSKGVGHHFTDELYASVSLGGAVQHDRDDHGNAYGGLSGRIIYKPTRNIGLMLDVQRRHTLGGDIGNYTTTKLQGRYWIQRNLDVRMTYEYDLDGRLSLSVGYHW